MSTAAEPSINTYRAPNGEWYAELVDDPETNYSGRTEREAIENLMDLVDG